MMGRISYFQRNSIASGAVGRIANRFSVSSREIVETMLSLTRRITR